VKIIHREQIELSPPEREKLSRIRFRKAIFLLGAYLAITAVLLLVYLTGWIGGNNITAEKMLRYQRATQILIGISFVLITIFFVVYYFKAVYPYTRDLKNGMKTVSWFYPAAYKTPYFDKFFLKTGSKKNPMLAIPQELYDAIRPGVLAFILFAPNSRYVLLLDIDGRTMEFNENNLDLEL
jgi:hypothetical protein